MFSLVSLSSMMSGLCDCRKYSSFTLLFDVTMELTFEAIIFRLLNDMTQLTFPALSSDAFFQERLPSNFLVANITRFVLDVFDFCSTCEANYKHIQLILAFRVHRLNIQHLDVVCLQLRLDFFRCVRAMNSLQHKFGRFVFLWREGVERYF